MKAIFYLSVCTALLLSSCAVDSGFDVHPNNATSADTTINLTPASGEAVVLTTTNDSVNTFFRGSVKTFTGTNMAPTTIEIDPSTTYQTIDGFGFALTYSSAYNLLHMSQAARTAFLKRTFSPTEGYGVSYLRISIGCSDFSSRVYTLCDTEGIDNFALQSDETNYIVPVLKEILAINPNVKIIASPWTCPRWMKTTETLSGSYDSWTGGRLRPARRSVYAQYFVKFIQAMQAEGISIYAVTPQNEPLNKGNCASLYMPWEDEAPFVRVLAGAFHKAGLTTKIYLYDHNYDYSGISSQNDYPVHIYNQLGSNFDGADLVAGAAYHDYGGTSTELSDIYNQAPTKEIIFSESSIGTWNKGNVLSNTLVQEMRDLVLGTVNKMSRAVIVWNLMLDDKQGPNLDGGCQTCYGAVDTNSSDYSTLHYNGHYYVICHSAAVVEPGAVRLGVSRNTNLSSLSHAEFLNPDGTYAALLCNAGDTDIKVTLSDGNKYFLATVPAYGVVSLKWQK